MFFAARIYASTRLNLLDSDCQVVNPDIVQLGFRKGDAVDAERARKWMSLERQGALTSLFTLFTLLALFTVFTLFMFFVLLSC